MRTVEEYDVPLLNTFSIELPLGAKFLSVRAVDGAPKLWALVDTSARRSKRYFRLAEEHSPLGGPVDLWMYLGTFQRYGAALHLWVLP